MLSCLGQLASASSIKQGPALILGLWFSISGSVETRPLPRGHLETFGDKVGFHNKERSRAKCQQCAEVDQTCLKSCCSKSQDHEVWGTAQCRAQDSSRRDRACLPSPPNSSSCQLRSPPPPWDVRVGPHGYLQGLVPAQETEAPRAPSQAASVLGPRPQPCSPA